MPIFNELGARQPARFTESQPGFDAAFVCGRDCCSVRCPQRTWVGVFSAEDSGLYSMRQNAVVIEYAMNPHAAHFAHGAVGQDGLARARPSNAGGIEAWLRLGEACGLPRAELMEDRHLRPGVRFAVDAYVNFARTNPWPVAIASSLTELFAPDLMKRRLAAFEKFYSWIDPRGLDYFRRRTVQARYDSNEALTITLEYCNTPELQREAARALEFKCDVLWSMLDAIHHAYRNC